MKKFILLTTSFSNDHYQYFIKADKKPTKEQIEQFLQEHANDIFNNEVCEEVDEIIEILDENFITI